MRSGLPQVSDPKAKINTYLACTLTPLLQVRPQHPPTLGGLEVRRVYDKFFGPRVVRGRGPRGLGVAPVCHLRQGEAAGDLPGGERVDGPLVSLGPNSKETSSA